jgi:hypothetical protein
MRRGVDAGLFHPSRRDAKDDGIFRLGFVGRLMPLFSGSYVTSSCTRSSRSRAAGTGKPRCSAPACAP